MCAAVAGADAVAGGQMAGRRTSAREAAAMLRWAPLRFFARRRICYAVGGRRSCFLCDGSVVPSLRCCGVLVGVRGMASGDRAKLKGIRLLASLGVLADKRRASPRLCVVKSIERAEALSKIKVQCFSYLLSLVCSIACCRSVILSQVGGTCRLGKCRARI